MKLLLTGAFKYSTEQMERLKSIGYETIFIQDERCPLQINVSDIDAVVCNSLFFYNDIKKFKKLKFIQLTSAGLDRIPKEYIQNQGIKLFNAQGVYSIPMAEWTILKILEIYKKSREFHQSQSHYKWEKQRELLELTEKTVAIIGFGDVGTEVAKRLKAFDTYVIGVGRRKLESPILDEYYLIDKLDVVLQKSDIIVLTLPLTENTRKLLDAYKLSVMKNNAVLINVSRGGVLDEAALIYELQKGKFSGVALDVFEEEPLSSSSKLWSFHNVLVTPHNSFVSDKTNKRLFELIEKNLKDYLQ